MNDVIERAIETKESIADETRFVRAATGAVGPSTVNADERTVDVIWTTGADVTRTDWMTGERYVERLLVDESAVNMGRMQSGAPLLNAHWSVALRDVIGVVTRAWIDGGQGHATVQLSSRDDVEPIWRDIVDGIIRHISVGYSVQAWSVEKRDGEPDIWTATRWEPMEISFVPMPADPGAGTRSAVVQPARTESVSMDEVTVIDPEVKTPEAAPNDARGSDAIDLKAERAKFVAEERSRIHRISRCVDVLGVSKADADAAIADGTSADAFVERAMTEAHARTAVIRTGIDFRVTRDEGETRIERIATGIAAQYGVEDKDGKGNEFRTFRLSDFVRDALETANINTRGLDREQMARVALSPGSRFTRGTVSSTTDLPYVFANALHKVLRQSYTVVPRTFTAWAQRNDLPDFRSVQLTTFGTSTKLLQVIEGAPIEFGKYAENKESMQLLSYARRLDVTRQMIINDDLGAMMRIPLLLGAAASKIESDIVYAVLTANGNLTDGVALFNATHANYTGTGTALSVTSLGVARAMLRKQTDFDGTPLNATLDVLVVPSALETLAETLVAPIYPAQTSNFNPFAGKFQAIAEPRLDASSATAWYGFSTRPDVQSIVYGYLTGNSGPIIEQEPYFETAGVQFRCIHDFGAAAADYRGCYKNVGA